MKNLLLPFFVLFAFAASAQIEETLKKAARNKVESQDFNSQRSNKERNMMDNNKKRSSPVAPPPPSPASAVPEPADSTTKAPADAPPVVAQTPVSGNAYTFGQKITYAIDNPSKPEKEKSNMTYYYGENAIMNVVPEQEMATIFNFSDETMTSISEKGKTATIMSARWINNEIAKEAASEDVTVTKTGQTKTILGYNCEEYIIQDPKSKVVCWITTDIKVDYAKAMQVMSKNVSRAYAENFDNQGISMEVTTYDKKGQADMHMIMTEYKEETTVKDLGGYTVTSLVMH